MVKRKDNTLVPVHLSICEGHVAGKTIFAAFLRDISEIKHVEGALVKEKDRADKLLLRYIDISLGCSIRRYRRYESHICVGW